MKAVDLYKIATGNMGIELEQRIDKQKICNNVHAFISQNIRYLIELIKEYEIIREVDEQYRNVPGYKYPQHVTETQTWDKIKLFLEGVPLNERQNKLKNIFLIKNK